MKIDKLEIEKQAIVGDREAILTVVSDLRRYRAICERLLGARYSDGTVDGATMSVIASDIGDIGNDED